MQNFIGYTISVVIAGLILLMVLALQFRQREVAVDTVQYEAAKSEILAFVAVVEQDFRNMGSQQRALAKTANDLAVDTAVTRIYPDPKGPDYAVSGSDTTWIVEFWGSTLPEQPAQRIRYEYTKLASETMRVMRNGTEQDVHVYDVVRLVDGAVTARSSGEITDFSVTPRMKEECDTTDPERIPSQRRFTRKIDVKIKAISPLGQGDYIEETVFQSGYTPLGMTRDEWEIAVSSQSDLLC
jgi:hypothetical protein